MLNRDRSADADVIANLLLPSTEMPLSRKQTVNLNPCHGEGNEMLMPMEKDAVLRVLTRRIRARWREIRSESYGQALVDHGINTKSLAVNS